MNFLIHTIFQSLNQDQINNLNRSIFPSEIKSVIKNLPIQKPWTKWIQHKIQPDLQRRIDANAPQISLQNRN